MQTALTDPTTTDAADFAHARGLLADCAHHGDSILIAACDIILRLAPNGCDAHRARALRETLVRTAGAMTCRGTAT